MDYTKLDEHITALREGNTLTENEVKALCEKVRSSIHECDPNKTRWRLLAARPMTRVTPCQLLL
jgi:hypothetical protein